MSSDFILALVLVIGVLFFVNIQQQRARIVLLARALHPYQIERLMQGLIGDYLRAMGETQAERRTQVLATLQESEHRLRAQLQRRPPISGKPLPHGQGSAASLSGCPGPRKRCPASRSICAARWRFTPMAWRAPWTTRGR